MQDHSLLSSGKLGFIAGVRKQMNNATNVFALFFFFFSEKFQHVSKICHMPNFRIITACITKIIMQRFE